MIKGENRMEKPITVLINDTKNAIISILNESNLHPILMEQIMNEIHTEVTNVLNQTIKKEKEEYEKSLEEEKASE